MDGREVLAITRGAEDRTAAGYEQHLELWVLPHVGHIELGPLTADDVDDLDQALAARGLSLTTRRSARGAFGRVLKHAARNRRITQDVTVFADRLAKGPNLDRTSGTLRPMEVRRLLAAASGSCRSRCSGCSDCAEASCSGSHGKPSTSMPAS